MYFLRLIRFKNLILLLFLLIIIRQFYGYESSLTEDGSLNFNTFSFLLFILSILLIASAGNIINDILDVKTDQINKPNAVIIDKHISKTNAFRIYLLFNLLSMVIAGYLSYKTGTYLLTVIYLATIFLLYTYSSKFKGIPLLGNFIIAAITPLPILILVYMDLPDSKTKHLSISIVFIIYFLGFLLNLIRELIKDIQDYKGDKTTNIKTFTVAYEKKTSLKLIRFITVFFIIVLQIIVFFLYPKKPILSSYLEILVLIPLLYITLKITVTNSKKMSVLLKIIMFLGMLSILLI